VLSDKGSSHGRVPMPWVENESADQQYDKLGFWVPFSDATLCAPRFAVIDRVHCFEDPLQVLVSI